MGTRFGQLRASWTSRSQVPSVEPPSTITTSAGGGTWPRKLGTSLPISSISLRTVAMMLTCRMGEV